MKKNISTRETTISLNIQSLDWQAICKEIEKQANLRTGYNAFFISCSTYRFESPYPSKAQLPSEKVLA